MTLLASVLFIALQAVTVWAGVEITGFKVKTLGRNVNQQVIIVTFFIEFRGECGILVIETEGVGTDGQAVTTAIITGECGGSRGSFTAELPIPYEKYDLIIDICIINATIMATKGGVRIGESTTGAWTG